MAFEGAAMFSSFSIRFSTQRTENFFPAVLFFVSSACRRATNPRRPRTTLAAMTNLSRRPSVTSLQGNSRLIRLCPLVRQSRLRTASVLLLHLVCLGLLPAARLSKTRERAAQPDHTPRAPALFFSSYETLAYIRLFPPRNYPGIMLLRCCGPAYLCFTTGTDPLVPPFSFSFGLPC